MLMSQEGTLAKISFKDGTVKVGWVDVNFNDSHIKILQHPTLTLVI